MVFVGARDSSKNENNWKTLGWRKRGEIIVGNQHVAQWEMRTFLVIGKAEKIFLHSTRNRKLSLLLLLS